MAGYISESTNSNVLILARNLDFVCRSIYGYQVFH